MKGVPQKAKKSMRAMKFKPGSSSPKPSTYKQKQRAWTMAGLRSLKAPMVGSLFEKVVWRFFCGTCLMFQCPLVPLSVEVGPIHGDMPVPNHTVMREFNFPGRSFCIWPL